VIRALLSALALAGAALPASAQTQLPFDLGGSYELTDQFGKSRTQSDPDGQAQLVFFGYANCPGICSTAMPLMAEVVNNLARQDIEVTPVMITVDPERDTVATMGKPLAEIHPGFVGLTGDQTALTAAYDAFSVEISVAYVDPRYGPIYSHGGLIHLLDADGTVLTVLPPVLDPDTVTGIVARYVTPSG